jgi:hypothetical protein
VIPHAPIPLTLEAIPDDPPAELGSDRMPNQRVVPPPRIARPATPLNSTESASASVTAPARGPSTMLGRVFSPTTSSESAARPRSSITVEPRSDPAAEAAIKRRIAKEIQQTVGDRARSVEIRVSGRTVLIRAQAARFWQRRSLRRSLETMPLPSGFRSKVELID